jgi:3-isopropylmalate/(R)-2-methylmalate dehydratase small subunit
LQDYGFKVVISSRFADIFRGNSGKGGLLTAVVDQAVVDQLWAATESDPTESVTVDLEQRTVAFADVVAPLEIDDYVRWRLLEGLDDIGITLQSADLIAGFERARPAFTPRTA